MSATSADRRDAARRLHQLDAFDAEWRSLRLISLMFELQRLERLEEAPTADGDYGGGVSLDAHIANHAAAAHKPVFSLVRREKVFV